MTTITIPQSPETLAQVVEALTWKSWAYSPGPLVQVSFKEATVPVTGNLTAYDRPSRRLFLVHPDYPGRVEIALDSIEDILVIRSEEQESDLDDEEEEK